MNIDVRTLILVIGFTHLIQVAVFYYQYKVNKSYNGPGWWLLWSFSEVIGFFSILLRDIHSILPAVIIVQNTTIILGTIFIYVGIMRFMDKKVNLKIIIPVFAIYVSTLLFFLFIINDIQIRSAIINFTLAAISFFTAYSLYRNRIKIIISSVIFNTVILILHGSTFAFRFVMVISGAQVADFFSNSFFNLLPFLDALIVSLLWTFGFIVMINQRLNSEMKEAKNDFEMIFNSSPDAVIITQISDGSILEVNAGFTSITGYSRQYAIGKSSLDILWKNEEDRKWVINEVLKNGLYENFEAKFQLKDGSEMVGLMSAKVFTFKGVSCIISITRDITERQEKEKKIVELNESLEKKVEERTKELTELLNEQEANQIALVNLVEDLNEKTDQLIRTTSQLQAANKELESFSYTVSHDLRTPLRALDGFANILLEDYAPNLDNEGKRLLGVIITNANKMGYLIDDLLAFSRLGRMELKEIKIDMERMVRSVYDELTSDKEKEMIDFRLHSIPGLVGDSAMMQQVWVNLIGNAIKFTSLKPTRIIEVGSFSEDNSNGYYIKDNGAGFNMAYSSKLFAVFQRLHSNNEFQGTGIGLSIVNRVVQRHNGRVWAEGKVDEGAAFYFTIPNNE